MCHVTCNIVMCHVSCYFRTAAERPLSHSKLGTLREKHNTVMLMIQAVEERNAPGHDGDDGDDDDDGHDVADKESSKDDNPYSQREEFSRSNDKTFKLSDLKQNAVTDSLFIGSYYVGVEAQSSKSSKSNSMTNPGGSWRVRL